MAHIVRRGREHYVGPRITQLNGSLGDYRAGFVKDRSGHDPGGSSLSLQKPRDEHSSEQRQQNDFKASHASPPGGTPPHLARVGPQSARLILEMKNSPPHPPLALRRKLAPPLPGCQALFSLPRASASCPVTTEGRPATPG